MEGLIWAEGRREENEDTEHTAVSSKGGSLRGTEAQGQGCEINLFLEYTDVFDNGLEVLNNMNIRCSF